MPGPITSSTANVADYGWIIALTPIIIALIGFYKKKLSVGRKPSGNKPDPKPPSKKRRKYTKDSAIPPIVINNHNIMYKSVGKTTRKPVKK